MEKKYFFLHHYLMFLAISFLSFSDKEHAQAQNTYTYLNPLKQAFPINLGYNIT